MLLHLALSLANSNRAENGIRYINYSASQRSKAIVDGQTCANMPLEHSLHGDIDVNVNEPETMKFGH